MATGLHYGELFYGVVKTHTRQTMHSIVTHSKYERIYYLACGAFNLVPVFVNAGYKPEQIYCSDISLYPSILGYLYSNQKIEDIPNLILPDEVSSEIKKFDDEFKKAAIIFYEMRKINLQKEAFRKIELSAYISNREDYIDQYVEKLKEAYKICGGINYSIQDMRDDYKEHGKDALVCVFPPIDTAYSKLFDYEGKFDLEIDVKFFEPEEFPEMFNKSLDWESHFVTFNDRKWEGIDSKHIFAAKYYGKGKFDFLYSNHHELLPDTVKNRLVVAGNKRYEPAPNVRIIDPNYRLTENSKVEVRPLEAHHALYYRGLWIHRMGTTSAALNYGLFIDGRIAGVFGIADTGKLSKYQTDYAFLQYTAMVPSNIYTNWVRLLERCLTCTDFKKILYKQVTNHNRLYRINGIKTNTYTKGKRASSSKGIFIVLKQEFDKKFRLTKFVEYAKFIKETFQDCCRDYIKEAKFRKGAEE